MNPDSRATEWQRPRAPYLTLTLAVEHTGTMKYASLHALACEIVRHRIVKPTVRLLQPSVHGGAH